MLRYLKGAWELLLKVGMTAEPLTCYSDSDWGGDLNDTKSTSRLLIRVHGTSVFSVTMKLDCIALSSTEAEHIAMFEACKMITWMRCLLK